MIELIGKVCVIRTYSAGVHVGEVVEWDGHKTVELKNATRIWRWRGANTLSELSQLGCDAEYSRVSQPVPSVILTEAIEILPCSAFAADSLKTPRWGT